MSSTGRSGPYRIPKFLLGGVNYKQNFLGFGTAKTAVYGLIETAIKVAPLFIVIYGASKLNYTLLTLLI